jgi:signal peptidase I
LPPVTPDPTDPALAVDEPPAGSPPGADAPPIPPQQPEQPPAPPSSGGRWVREGVIVVVVAVLVAVLLRAFVVQTFYIPSGSMEPTLQIGDRILVNKLSYHLHGVDRGNIVVFSRPPTESCGGPEVNDLVKRVIGMPGDVLTLSGGHVYVDGKRLNETWLPASEQGVTSAGPQGSNWNLSRPYRVPANNYFVMGDNRTDSCDSRYWGPIAKSLIVGKVEVRVWPISSLRIF